MNSIERVFMALQKKEPDRVPIIEPEIHEDIIKRIMGPEASLYDFIEEFDLDAICVGEDVVYEEEEPGIKRDHFGLLRDFRSMSGLSWPVPLNTIIKNDFITWLLILFVFLQIYFADCSALLLTFS